MTWRPVLAAVTLALPVLLATGCASSPAGLAEISTGGSGGWKGTAVTAGYPLPDQEFTDTSGATVVPARDVAAPTTLVFFGYTHCPDICNVVLANVAAALRGVPQSLREQTRVGGESRVVWAEDVSVADLRADLVRLARLA